MKASTLELRLDGLMCKSRNVIFVCYPCLILLGALAFETRVICLYFGTSNSAIYSVQLANFCYYCRINLHILMLKVFVCSMPSLIPATL